MITQPTTPAVKRRMARPKVERSICAQSPKSTVPSKLDQIAEMLRREGGASICEIMAITGWQQHSVRGALAGTLKKRGLVIVSEKAADGRRYRIGAGE